MILGFQGLGGGFGLAAGSNERLKLSKATCDMTSPRKRPQQGLQVVKEQGYVRYAILP